uniref:Uncharacterized protein n=1 Tax=Alexandrium catenella TaxID=2925 RepID=A0A7S1QN33_ALECA|mmetsp:Transcript_35524/g.96298  ORF Transcript_35524/g.96298 Transcript_35524/m.96298 type:complete len:111 (+) Transcript_35524:64-396(+)
MSSDQEDEEEASASQSRSRRREEDQDRSKEPEAKEVLDGWLRDLMTGFAEIYTVTIAGGHSCGDCVRRAAYPVKERLVTAYDDVANTINPSTEARTARGEFAAAPTFAHE